MKTTICCLYLLPVLLVWAPPAMAEPDTYLGDTSIYAAVDSGGGERPRPHVLFIIDTSQATMNKAAGTPYDSTKAYEGAYDKWSIYSADTQGNFSPSRVELANSTNALENLTCRGTVYDTLVTYGTYSGSGSAASPNLKGAACDIAPKGATYTLGNYQNYLNPAGGAADILVQNRYDCVITYKSRGAMVPSPLIADGCIGTFKLSASHTTDAISEPGMGTDWQRYWAQVSAGCYGTASTFCVTGSSPAPLTLSATTPPPWASGVSQSVSASQAGLTQRELIYNAIEEAVGGARNAVNIGAMAYNPNNQGGELVYNIADLRSQAAFDAFLLEVKNARLIASGPNRPQAEALFDAGHYYGAQYPTSANAVTRNADGTLTVSGAVSSTVGINSALKSTDFGTTHRNPCDYNHIILITNGLSNGDNNPSMQNVVDSDGDGRSDESVYGQGSHYADDVAAYLKKHEKITTHSVLAFQTEDNLVHRIGTQGGGQFFNVYDSAGLAKALNKILAGIVNDIDTSFVAPVVPASSTNRTLSSSRVYLGLFKPQNNAPWYGNLKKYGVNADLQLVDKYNALATDASGEFIASSKSYWGSVGSQTMGESGLLDATKGDGGVVSAGGVGGQLKIDLLKARALSTPTAPDMIRYIYTKPTTSTSNDLTLDMNRFRLSNTTHLPAAALGVATDAERTKLIKFVHGFDGYDDNADNNTDTVRNWVLGDILHSKPLIFNYNSFTPGQENDPNYNKTMIYVGANDGMLHAFRDCDGSEAWAFIPPNLLPMLKFMRDSDHNYFSDGAATAYVHDFDSDGIVDSADGDKVVLVFGQRRGGGRNTLMANDAARTDDARGAFFALDVTNPEKPEFLWSIDSNNPDFAELGETWTQPRLLKVKVNDQVKVVAFVGAGYDNNEDLRFGDNMNFPLNPADPASESVDTTLPTYDGGTLRSSGAYSQTNPRGRGIYAIEVATLTGAVGNIQPSFTSTGRLVWKYTYAQNPALSYSIPSDLTPMDSDGNGYTDRIYVGDTGGRIWRFDIGDNTTATWSGSILFNANSDTATNAFSRDADPGSANGKGRKFFYRPALAQIGGVPTLYIGSGDREHPLNRGVVDRLYAIKDPVGRTTVLDSTDLVNVTANELQGDSTTTARIAELKNQLYGGTDAFGKTWYGWFLDLENVGEKNLSSPLVFSGQVFYTTYAPKTILGQCEIGNLGVARLYHLDAITAEAVADYSANGSTNGNERAIGANGEVLTKNASGDDRVLSLGEGIPSGITVQLDASGKASLMISSSNKVNQYGAPDAKMITPLYWLEW